MCTRMWNGKSADASQECSVADTQKECVCYQQTTAAIAHLALAAEDCSIELAGCFLPLRQFHEIPQRAVLGIWKHQQGHRALCRTRHTTQASGLIAVLLQTWCRLGGWWCLVNCERDACQGSVGGQHTPT